MRVDLFGSLLADGELPSSRSMEFFKWHDSFLCCFLHQMKPLCIYSLWLVYVLHLISLFSKGFVDDAVVKNSSANSGGSGEVGSIPGPGRSPREGNGSLLQYCCLENPMDKATWQAAAHWVTKIWTYLSGWAWAHTHTHTHAKLFFKLPNVSYFVKYLCPVRVLVPESNRKEYQNIQYLFQIC